MDAVTINRLNQINREFYRITAEDFDQTRGEAWPGWERLLPYLHSPLSALDVGCGNGRFGVFLQEKLVGARHIVPLQDAIYYHGVDSNAALLEHAQETLQTLPGLDVTLGIRDVVENPPETGEYDVVVLFGVMHHIPGYAERQVFIRRLAERVKAGGLLAFACWRFYEYARFRERIVPWPEDITVEAGDYLLDWRRGVTALRYCHYVDDAEHAALVAATGMAEILMYRADGKSGDANRYSLLRKNENE
ncbi:MAG: class I SAM-dependent methyltransferase [Anaerolineae bacterium]|nr:class I SAM-dependent methyltransferase [Anaerolineae bacterium]